jgi:3-oxoacid CoA-transferase subunit B
MMEHQTRKGDAKILKECTLPLTGVKVVHQIISDLAVIDVVDDGLILRETAPGVTAQEVQAATDAELQVAPDCREMSL